MPTPVIYALQADPAFRALSPGAQMIAAERYVGEELRRDPGFLALSPGAQKIALQKYVLQAVTFDNDPGIGERSKELMTAELFGRQGSTGARQFTEGLLSFRQSSGFLGVVDKLGQALGMSSYDPSRQRALEYFQAANAMLGQEDKAAEIGSFLGTVADTVGVSLVMSPVTGLATKGVGVLARGGAAAVKGAQAAGRAAPIVSRAVAVLGPVAAETAIEAVPYMIVEDQRRIQQGLPSLFSEDAGTVLRSMGTNAAIDFTVGAVLTGALHGVRAGIQIFKNPKVKNLIIQSEDEFQKILSQTRAGTADPEMLARLKIDQPITYDRVQTSLLIDEYVRKGVADPTSYRWHKTAYLAHDLSAVAGRLDDGTYRLWDTNAEGKVIQKSYETLEDLEDTLSYSAYQKWLSLPVEDQGKFLSAHTGWALPRGKTLSEQQALFGNPAVLDPILPTKTVSGAATKPISKRVVVTQGEAQGLSTLSGDATTVVMAQVPLKGGIAKAANMGDLNLNRAAGPVTVSPHDIPNAVFVGVKAAPLNLYEETTVAAQRALTVDPSIPLERARASILMDLGYDHIRLPNGRVEFFTGRNMKLIGDPDLIVGKAVKADSVGQVSPIAVVTGSRVFQGGAEALQGNEDLIMSAASKALKSQDNVDMQNFSRLYTANRGVDLDVNVVRNPDAPTVRVTREGNQLKVELPLPPTSTWDEAAFLDDLVRGLDDAVPAGKATKAVDYWGSKFASRVQAFQLPSGASVRGWLEAAVTRLGGSLEDLNGNLAVKLPSGTTIYKDPQAAVNFLARRIADPSLVKLDFQRQGLRLTETKAGFRLTSIRDGRLVATGLNLSDLLDRVDYVPSSLDLAFGPKVVAFENGKINFEIAGNLSYADPEKAFQALSKWKDTRLLTQKRLLSASTTRTLSELPAGRYEVYLGEFGARRSFDTLAEARDFLRKADDPEIASLREMMQSKYGDLTIQGSNYVVRLGPNRYVARDMDELKAIVKKIPDISESAPRLLDEIDPSIEANVADLVAQQKLRAKYRAGPNPYGLAPEPAYNPHEVKLDAYDIGRAPFANFTAWIEDISKKYDVKPLAATMAKLRDGKRLADMTTNAANQSLLKIFRTPNGKLLSEDSRRRIFYHLAGQNSEDAAALATQYSVRYKKPLIALTPEEEVVASRVKEFLVAAGDRFGIAYEKLIFNYMPKLRDLTDNMNAELLANLTTGDELLRNLPNYEPPKEIKFWAEHERLDEITRFFLKDDALEVLQLYMAQGSKKAYMNEPWKELYQFIQTAKLGEDITTRVNAFRMDLMSSYHTPAEKMTEQFGAAFFRGIKRLPGIGQAIKLSEQEMENLGKGILNHALSTVYISSMGWRPMLAIRNAVTPWTMAAPRIGVDWMARAYDDVLKTGQPVYDRLLAKGVLSEKPPIVNSPFMQDTPFGRLAQASLRPFKQSDDLTRAVCYRSAELRFENAVGLWDSNRINTRTAFENAAGLDIMDDTTRETAWKLFSSGDPAQRAAAQDLFANKFQRDAMFDYSGADSPMVHKGVIGRLFGQFGSFSAGYRANMANMFKYGSAARRVEMVATYLAMTGLLYAGFEALRVKTNDFVPFAPTFFGGGPAINLVWNAIKSTGTGYEAEQARSELGRDITGLIPGSAQARYLTKALELASQGDSYGAFLSLTGTSVKPLW